MRSTSAGSSLRRRLRLSSCDDAAGNHKIVKNGQNYTAQNYNLKSGQKYNGSGGGNSRNSRSSAGSTTSTSLNCSKGAAVPPIYTLQRPSQHQCTQFLKPPKALVAFQGTSLQSPATSSRERFSETDTRAGLHSDKLKPQNNPISKNAVLSRERPFPSPFTQTIRIPALVSRAPLLQNHSWIARRQLFSWSRALRGDGKDKAEPGSAEATAALSDKNGGGVVRRCILNGGGVVRRIQFILTHITTTALVTTKSISPQNVMVKIVSKLLNKIFIKSIPPPLQLSSTVLRERNLNM
jgi:hypothetical protein